MINIRSEVAASVLLGFLALPFGRAAATVHIDFEAPVFAEAQDLYAKDHSLIRHSDGVYHLFYAVGRAGEAWNLAGNEIEIGHATSGDLTHWTIHPRVLATDTLHRWKSRNVWAPHVLKADVQIGSDFWPYLMTYTGVDSLRNQQIGVAVSVDLFLWTDLSVQSGAHRPNTQWAMWDPDSTWQNCRDSFVFRRGEELVLLTSVLTRPGYLGLGTLGAIALATSEDGLTWVDRGSPLALNDHSSLMSSSHLVENPISGLWHLLYTRPVVPGGIHMLTSSDLDRNWSLSSDMAFDPAGIASEIARFDDGDIYSHAVDFLTQTDLPTRAVRFQPMTWSESGPVTANVNPFWQQWTLVEGELGAMPTFRDRPMTRSGAPSNMDGLFWVNTAEDDSGPFGGCPTCGPNEQLTGVLRSHPFAVAQRSLRLWVGGSNSSLTYVALIDKTSGELLRIAQGSGSDVMAQREWDLTGLIGSSVYLEVVDRHTSGHVSVDRIEWFGEVVGLPGPGAPLLSAVGLGPNPTPGPVFLSYVLGQPAEVSLAIYGAGGRLVRRVAGGTQDAHRQTMAWDGLATSGEPAPPGVYFLRLEIQSGGETTDLVKRLTVLR